jgi:uncharacterized protein (TIGR02246 family)
MNRRLLPLALALLPLSALRAQETAAAADPPAAETAKPSATEEALTKTQAAFMEAFNKADAAAVAEAYDETATYTSDSGKYMDGRAAILAGMKDYFQQNPGARLQVQTHSVREVTPDVAVATGMAIFSGTAGAVEMTRYKAIYARRGGAWKIVELTENVLPPAERGQVELRALDWLAGSWRDKTDGGDTVRTEAAWTQSGRFLRRSISVSHGGAEVMQATEIIGWDPARSEIRSWVFDSDGGFGEGVWTQEGSRWMVRALSTLPDGRTAAALHVFTPKDANSYTWESTSREIDGQVMPNVDKVEVVREPAPAK